MQMNPSKNGVIFQDVTMMTVIVAMMVMLMVMAMERMTLTWKSTAQTVKSKQQKDREMQAFTW